MLIIEPTTVLRSRPNHTPLIYGCLSKMSNRIRPAYPVHFLAISTTSSSSLCTVLSCAGEQSTVTGAF